MNKEILDKVLSLSRGEKIYLYNKLNKTSQIESINNFEQEVFDILSERVSNSGPLGRFPTISNAIHSYLLNPNNISLENQIHDFIDDIFMEMRDSLIDAGKEDELQVIWDNFDQNPNQIYSKIADKLNINIPPEEKQISNEQKEEQSDIIEAGGKKYKIQYGVFNVPVDDQGNALVRTDFLDEIVNTFFKKTFHNEKFSPDDISSTYSPENFKQQSPSKPPKGLLNTKKVLSEYYSRYQEFFATSEIYEFMDNVVQERVKKKLGVNILEGVPSEEITNAYQQILNESQNSDNPNDIYFDQMIKNIRFYDDISKDIFGYYQRWYISERIGNDVYDKIKAMSDILYSSNFEEDNNEELYVIVDNILSGNTNQYSPEFLNAWEELYKVAEQRGMDDKSISSILKDFFLKNSLKYYETMHKSGFLYQAQMELSRIPDPSFDATLKYFCPDTFRFRQEKIENQNVGSEEGNAYYYRSGSILKFNLKAYPNKEIPPQFIDMISPEVLQAVQEGTNKESIYLNYVDNFLAPKDSSQNDPETYWKMDEVVISHPKIGEIILEDKKGKPIRADHKYIEYINTIFDKLIELGEDPNILRSNFIDFIKLTSNLTFSDDFESNEEGMRAIKSSLNVFNNIRKIIDREPNFSDLKEIKTDTLDNDSILNLYALREFSKLLPFDVPSKTWQTTILLGSRADKWTDMEKIAPMLGKVGLASAPYEYLDIAASPGFKGISDHINRFMVKLAIEFLNQENDNQKIKDEDQFVEAMNFLKARRLRIPVVMKKPKGQKEKLLEVIEEFEKNKAAIRDATSLESLEEKGFVAERDFIFYDAKPEELADRFSELISFYRNRLRDYSHIGERPVLKIENLDIPKEIEPNKSDQAKFNTEKKRQFNLKTLEKTNFSYLPYLNYFKNYLIRSQDSSIQMVQEEYNKRFNINNYVSAYPKEDMALLFLFDQENKKVQGEVNFEDIKLALQKELEPIVAYNSGKNISQSQVFDELGQKLGATPEFLNNIFTDINLHRIEKVKKYLAPALTEPASLYRIPSANKELMDSYPSFVHTLDLFLNSDYKTSQVILNHSFGKNTILEPELIQAIALGIFNNYNSKTFRDRTMYHDNLSLKQIVHLATLAKKAGIPERNDMPNYYGFTEKGRSLASVLFSKLPINILNSNFSILFSKNNSMGERIHTKAKKINWYKTAMKRRAKVQGDFESVILYTPQDILNNASNMGKFSNPVWGWPTSLSRISKVSFGQFGNYPNLIDYEQNNDVNTVLLSREQDQILQEAGLF